MSTCFSIRFINPDLVDLSNVVMSQDIVLGHFIDEKSNQTSAINLIILKNIFMPSLEFLAEYLALILFSLIFVLILKFGFKKNIQLFNFFYGALSEHGDVLLRKCTSVSQLFLFNLLFLFFVKQILFNNVNTQKIVVDIENLLYSKEKIYKTKKGWFFPSSANMHSI